MKTSEMLLVSTPYIDQLYDQEIDDPSDIIFENLELVAKDIQSTKQSPVPLYVAVSA